MYYDLEDMIKTNKDGQVPYTPVLPLLYGMQASMKLMRAEGFENVIKRHHRYVIAVCMTARLLQFMLSVFFPFCTAQHCLSMPVGEPHHTSAQLFQSYRQGGLCVPGENLAAELERAGSHQIVACLPLL